MTEDIEDVEEGEVEWLYTFQFGTTYDTRHEAVGEAAITARERGDSEPDPTIGYLAACGCKNSVESRDTLGSICGRCGGTIWSSRTNGGDDD